MGKNLFEIRVHWLKLQNEFNSYLKVVLYFISHITHFTLYYSYSIVHHVWCWHGAHLSHDGDLVHRNSSLLVWSFIKPWSCCSEAAVYRSHYVKDVKMSRKSTRIVLFFLYVCVRFDKHSQVVKSITVLKILDAFGAHLEKPQRGFLKGFLYIFV